MLDGHDVNMTNPLYRRRDMMDGDDDEDDEQDSLRSQSIYIGGNVGYLCVIPAFHTCLVSCCQ